MSSSAFLTPKQIAKRLKSMAKGKEHLYCQFCQRQFRDNTTGFDTHKKSHEHLENVREFLKDPQSYIQQWSAQFEKMWNDIVTFRYRNKEVRVTVVYDEFTSMEEHVRLHATKWKELMGFVRDWAKRNKDKVTITNKAGSYFIKWDESNEEAAARRFGGESKKRKRTDLERHMSDIRRQVKAAKREEEEQQEEKIESTPENPAPTKEKASFGKISIESKPVGSKETLDAAPAVPASIFQLDASQHSPESTTSTTTSLSTTLAPPKPHFLPGIIVRVMNKKLDTGSYHKKKGTVLKIVTGKGRPLLQLEMQPSGDVIQVPEKQVETVIPNLNREVLCLKGEHRGHAGILVELQKKEFNGVIRLKESGKEVCVPYDDFSKKS
uniref:C2H2-type domain-containing protein n=1 Tax=Percolomonas cosmopolitus TaxID=63605 RepID=A0A7S1KPV2_9EUKA